MKIGKIQNQTPKHATKIAENDTKITEHYKNNTFYFIKNFTIFMLINRLFVYNDIK